MTTDKLTNRFTVDILMFPLQCVTAALASALVVATVIWYVRNYILAVPQVMQGSTVPYRLSDGLDGRR